MQRRSLLALPFATLLSAQQKQSLFTGNSLDGWKSQDGKPMEWTAKDGILANGPKGHVNNIFTSQRFGDLELSLEFRIPKGSNSGIYLHGLYEVQIFDSFGKAKIDATDSGSIYHRWIDAKPVGGHIAKTNASLAPGEWQTIRIQFRAPRFDNSGRKTENARFLEVTYNGKLVQQNAECDGGTRSHMLIPEAPTNPLMLQGDHGPVEFRNISYTSR
jgi:hypothetical protein